MQAHLSRDLFFFAPSLALLCIVACRTPRGGTPGSAVIVLVLGSTSTGQAARIHHLQRAHPGRESAEHKEREEKRKKGTHLGLLFLGGMAVVLREIVLRVD